MPTRRKLVRIVSSFCLCRTDWANFEQSCGISSMTSWIWMEMGIWISTSYGQHSKTQVCCHVPDLLRALKASSGIEIDPETLSDFMSALSSDSDQGHVTFGPFRDFLILLPRKASTKEIYRFYKMRKYLGDDGRGAARVNMEGALTKYVCGLTS